MNQPIDTSTVDFHFDVMCPYAYQTSKWIRRVRDQIDLTAFAPIDWPDTSAADWLRQQAPAEAVRRAMEAASAALGFRIERTNIEALGLCPACSGAEP